jgi:hypothetical protein
LPIPTRPIRHNHTTASPEARRTDLLTVTPKNPFDRMRRANQMSDKPEEAPSSVWTIDLKTLTVIGPLFASALAVLYDVGFFAGINIDFFTFFTLSEHLLFALQAIPLAAFTAYSAGGFFLGSWIGAKNTDTLLAKLQAEPDLEKRQALAAPYLARVSRFDRWRSKIVICAFAMAGISLGVGSYVSAFATAVTAILIMLKKDWTDLQKLDRKAVAFGASLFILVLAFLTGYERAGHILKTKIASENILIDDKITPARIIRSGERGVLFLSIDTKKLRFIRWDAIKQIETL